MTPMREAARPVVIAVAPVVAIAVAVLVAVVAAAARARAAPVRPPAPPPHAPPAASSRTHRPRRRRHEVGDLLPAPVLALAPLAVEDVGEALFGDVAHRLEVALAAQREAERAAL